MFAETPRQSPFISGLALAAAVALIAAYFMPLWWVSLTAPNYPKDAFPDGIRIHFQFAGVVNGCTTAPATSRVAQETQQEDLGWRSSEGVEPKAGQGAEKSATIDCVHEMNTINHYVGMHPIGFGAPLELLLSKFIIGILAVMLVGFAIGAAKPRVVALGAGFAGVTSWMLVDLFALGRANEFIAHYMDEAGKYFREAEKIAHWGSTLHMWIIGVVAAFIIIMVTFTWASARWPGFQLTLGIVPAFMPVFFVVSYASWLWYFGHSLHPWGAFTVKPFMPTVFGDGKVAQFTTHSYPHVGFALLAFATLSLVVAVARRRIELGERAAPATAVSDAPSKAA